MSCCCITSPFDLPSVSIPAGFTNAGLPVGLQIVGKYGDDWGVLQAAYAFRNKPLSGNNIPPFGTHRKWNLQGHGLTRTGG